MSEPFSEAEVEFQVEDIAWCPYRVPCIDMLGPMLTVSEEPAKQRPLIRLIVEQLTTLAILESIILS